MYRSYSVNDMPEPVRYKNEIKKPQKECVAKQEEICEKEQDMAECCEEILCEDGGSKRNGILSGLNLEDIIILAVIFLLLMDNCEDKLLLIALGLVLFSDFFDFKI